MISLLDFKRNALQHDVCNRYLTQWNDAKSTKDLIDTALAIQGIEFIAKSIAEGWGISPSVISSQFKEYINGRYIHDDPHGYTSALYCQHEGELSIRTTNTLVIDSHCVLNIPDGHLCNIYVTGASDIVVFNENAYVHVTSYSPASVIIKGNGRTHITQI